MALPNIFSETVSAGVINRINSLSPEMKPTWGKMEAAQMLAHCNVSYELVYYDIHPQPNFILKQILKMFVKKKVTDETPYTKNMRTAPAFLIKESKDFAKEKARLINHIKKTQALGESEFHNKPSHSFGPLTITEWNNLFYKHLDHHLNQFGV